MTTGTKYRIRRRSLANGEVVWITPEVDAQNTTDYLVDVPPGPGRFTYELCVTHYNSGFFSGDDVTFAYLTALVIRR